jgi:hypothetical protein
LGSSDPGTLIAPPVGGGRYAITNSYTPIGVAVSISPDSAYEVIKRVYTMLEIPVSQSSLKDHSVGNDRIEVRRKLGGLNMQDILDCGEKLDTPNAENWDIQMSLFSSAVVNKDGGSTVLTQIQAMGHDPSQGNTRWNFCSTTSALEEKIGSMIKAAIVN